MTRLIELSSFKKVSTNTLLIVAERGARIVLAITVGVWTSRYLGPENNGVLALSIAYISVFQTVMSLGLDLTLAAELPKRPTISHMLLGTALILRLLAGVLCTLIAVAGACVFLSSNPNLLKLILIVSPTLLFLPSNIVDLWFQSKLASEFSLIPRLTAAIISSVLRVTAIYMGLSLWVFGTIYLIESAITAILLATSYRLAPTFRSWRWHSSVASATMFKSIPLLLSGLAVILHMRIDQFMISAIKGDVELGKYASVLPFSQAWSILATAICASMTPLLSTQIKHNRLQFDDQFVRLTAFLLRTSFIVVIAMYPISMIVGVLLGEQYSGVENILIVYSASNIPLYLTVAQLTYLSITGETGTTIVQAFLGLASCVVLNVLLIPPYGAIGAAISLSISYFMSGTLCNLYLNPRLFSLQLKGIGQALFLSAR